MRSRPAIPLLCALGLTAALVEAQSGTDSQRRTRDELLFDEPLALASPRPVLLIAPTLDRYARIEDVRAEVRAVAGVTLETPTDFNRFGRKFQARVLDWLGEVHR